jgi:uncharacterized protein (TIGR00255 family)
MTGYGRGSVSRHGMAVVVEISSVNRKQLDITQSLPRGLNHLEPRIADECARHLSRGRVSVDVQVKWSSRAKRESVRVDEDLVASYVSALRATAKKNALDNTLAVRDLLTLPDVLHFANPGEDLERVWTILKPALIVALKDLNRMRGREGRKLEQDLRTRLLILEKALSAIEKEAPLVAARYKKALWTRLEAAGYTALDDERLLREVVLFADKSDITEEITRLQSHVDQARKMTRSKEATGRAMDFLAQEMFREINTIGSKANDSEILRYVVSFKAELERIREQVQNIE